MKMEERVTEPEQQPSKKNAGKKARAKRKQEKKKRRRPQPGPKQFHLWMPAFCSPAIAHLKQEMNLRSCGATIHWLIRQVRPELVPDIKPPTKPIPTRPNPETKSLRKTESVDDVSVLNPACMPDMSYDNPHSDIPVVAASDPPAARSPVRATVVQASTVFFNTPATLDKAERLIAGAAAYGSQLVVFPEAFVGGYPRCVRFDGATITNLSTDEDENLHKYYASAIDLHGPEVERLAKIAGKYKVYLVIGVVERAGLYLYSTVLFFDSLGQHLGQNRKQTLMAPETAVWYSGEKSSMQIYDTSIGKIGALVCWDNKLPLLRTKLYDKGVEIYCAPTSDAGEIWKASMTHIALEGSCFVLSANQFCRRRDYPLPSRDSYGERSLDAITCAGGSVIISPSGTILAGPNYQGECLISADLDVGVISEAKSQFGGVTSNFGGNYVGQTINGSDSSLIEIEVKMGIPPSPVELSE